MKSLKEMLEGMADRKVTTLANKCWDAYQDDGEYGIAKTLDADPAEAVKMLDSIDFDIDTAEQLADCMMIYRDGGTEEAYLKAELRQLKAREAAVRARLKELEAQA
jgi:hypothetical protein